MPPSPLRFRRANSGLLLCNHGQKMKADRFARLDQEESLLLCSDRIRYTVSPIEARGPLETHTRFDPDALPEVNMSPFFLPRQDPRLLGGSNTRATNVTGRDPDSRRRKLTV